MVKITLLLVLLTGSCFAQSQIEMNAEANLNLEKSDALLNKVYTELLKNGDDAFDQRLRSTQRVWLQYVELHMQCLLPLKKGENPREVYGSIYHLEYAYAKSQLFDERIKQLKKLN